MKINDCYCIVKRTDYEHLNFKNGSKLKKMPDDFQKKIKLNHAQHQNFLASFLNYSAKIKLKPKIILETNINKIKPEKNDLILTCGGDGTFLSCAQNFPNSTLLGMNSSYDPNSVNIASKGALTKVNITNLEFWLDIIKNNKFKIEHWSRLQASINGKLLPNLAVNDIFLGNKTSYLTSNVSLEFEDKSEDFNCSGVIACTGMGSHAWFAAAGGSFFSNDFKAFGFMVLMPSAKWQLKFASGISNEKSKIKIIPHRDDYVLSFDSREDIYMLKTGDVIKIGLAVNNPLQVLSY